MTGQSSGSVALSVGKIEADLSGEGIDPSSPVAATDVGVRGLPVLAGGDRARGANICDSICPIATFEELLVERDVEVDHVTVFRCVQRFTPLLADAARFARHSPSVRWHVDETYVKVNGVWRYAYRAADQHGQVIDVLVSARRDAAAARQSFRRTLASLKVTPTEVVTDAAPVCPAVLEDLVPSAWHHVERYATNPIEADHGRLKHRLRPMLGLRTDKTAQVSIAGHAFIQNLRRGRYELTATSRPAGRCRVTELARAI